jgi:hypothetical protein
MLSVASKGIDGRARVLQEAYGAAGRAEREDIDMVWLIGALTLALLAMSATWGTIGTLVILITAVAWLLVAFQPVQAGAMVANLARRRFE